MVIIKKLNVRNWADEQRLPENIIVVRKEPLGLSGELGALINEGDLYRGGGEFWIITVQGSRYGPLDGVEEAILKWERDFDFYYIDIKP